MKPIVDKILSFTISKKLTVFAVATVLAFSDNLDSSDWMYIAISYIWAQGIIDYNKIKK